MAGKNHCEPKKNTQICQRNILIRRVGKYCLDWWDENGPLYLACNVYFIKKESHGVGLLRDLDILLWFTILVHCQIHPALTSCTLGLCNSRTMVWNTPRSHIWMVEEGCGVIHSKSCLQSDRDVMACPKMGSLKSNKNCHQDWNKLLSLRGNYFSFYGNDFNNFIFNKSNHHLKTAFVFLLAVYFLYLFIILLMWHLHV